MADDLYSFCGDGTRRARTQAGCLAMRRRKPPPLPAGSPEEPYGRVFEATMRPPSMSIVTRRRWRSCSQR